MKRFDRETWLEAGILALALGILGGVASLIYGKASGSVSHTRKQRQAPPQPGSIQPEKQSNVNSNPAR